MSAVSLTVYDAARNQAVVLGRPEIRTLELTGVDRVEFLDGMLSQDVVALPEGGGIRALKCTAKGRIEAYVRVRRAPEVLLVDVRSEVASALLETLAEHIVMEDCQLRDISADRDVLSLIGPLAYQLLESVGLGAIDPELPADHFEVVGRAVVVADASFGIPGYEVHAPAGSLQKRLQALVRAGATLVDHDLIELLRVEAGEPKDGAELDLETLPMEARLGRAVSLTKGCYVGQEVVARGTNLGQVNHLLVGLRLSGGLPAGDLPAPLSVGERPVGEVDSVVYSPRLGVHIGLGYVRREHEAPGQRLVYVSASGPADAIVSALPFES